MKNQLKNIAILCSLDAYANSVRPLELKKFIESLGHKATLISNGKIVPGSKDEKIGAPEKGNGLVTNARSFFDKVVNGPVYYHYFLLKLIWRAKQIRRAIGRTTYDLLIIENHLDAFAADSLGVPYVLDLESPLPDELLYSGKLDSPSYRKLIRIYQIIYAKARYINFQWHMYGSYVRKNIYRGDNFIEINYGCGLRNESQRAQYSPEAKIICLGYLGGTWVNLPLLSQLSKLYPIDIYGGPEPDRKWELNYKGYAPSTDIMNKYQFGLITISKDKLRRSSFSSKHLEYISYGLPVLTPSWRRDPLLADVSIYYNESDFLKKIRLFSRQTEWNKMSDKCYDRAKSFQWPDVLKPFTSVINSIN